VHCVKNSRRAQGEGEMSEGEMSRGGLSVFGKEQSAVGRPAQRRASCCSYFRQDAVEHSVTIHHLTMERRVHCGAAAAAECGRLDTALYADDSDTSCVVLTEIELSYRRRCS